jgi:uncharacterized protein (TIGR04255 family)
MGEVQREFEDRLSNLFVPTVEPGEPLALRPYQLRDPTESRSLALSFNQATYVAFDYPGYEEFGAEAVRVLGRALELLRVEDLTRVVYFYDNAIDLPVEKGGKLPLHLLLNLDFPNWLGQDDFSQLHLEWRRLWERGFVMGKVFQETSDGRVTLRMQLRAGAEPGGDAKELATQVEATHARACELFDSMVTDRFRAFLSTSPEQLGGGRDE